MLSKIRTMIAIASVAVILIVGLQTTVHALGTDVNTLFNVSRARPTAKADGSSGPGVSPRADGYGEFYQQNVIPTKHVLSDEGSYNCFNNSASGTPGSGIAEGGATQTAFVATTPTFLIYNSAPSTATQPKLYVDFASMVVTAAGTAGASAQFAVVKDSGNRYSSGGTALTAFQTNSTGVPSVSKAYFGAITATAASANAVNLASGYFRPVIQVVGDMFQLQFGSVDSEPGNPFSSTVAANIVVPQPPVIVNPNETLMIYTWYPSESASGSAIPNICEWER